MEKIDLQTFVDSKLSFHCNEHIAIFCNFEEVRNHAISDILIDGFFFAVVTHGQSQVSIDEKTYLLQEGDII